MPDYGSYDNAKCADKLYISERAGEPKFLQVDRRIKETEADVDTLKKLLESKQNYLKQLHNVRKMVTPADEAKIQALISAGLL